LAGSTVTNTGPTIINGDLGISPGASCTGFDVVVVAGCSTLPLGDGHVNGTIHPGDAVAAQAQIDNIVAYNDLRSRPPGTNLSGVDLGGQTLIAGVYNFDTSAQLTGTLTLDGQGNPNSIFIINIGSTLTTASNSVVSLINGAQGGNVFFTVGTSATLGTSTDFEGIILALASITLNTDASIDCGAAWAQTGAVTLDNNLITVCTLLAAEAADVLPDDASENEIAIANAIDAFIAAGGTLPPEFADMLALLSPAELAAALTLLSGEVATGFATGASQATNSFLSLLTSPFSDADRPFTDSDAPPIVVKGYAREGAQSSVRSAFASFDGSRHRGRWGIWGAVYGSRGKAAGDPLGAGTHDRSARSYGFATGLDYRVNDYAIVGFALAGGRTHFGLSDGLGGGSSNMFQAAVYGTTRVNAAYLSGALAYSWHEVSTDRTVTLFGTDRLVADYTAHNLAARVEGGYRYALPTQPYWQGRSGITPYAAAQVQLFRTPSYSESAASGSDVFALAYEARTTTTARTELGAWYDWSASIDPNTFTSVRARLAWAHDFWSSPEVTASFVALPGSSFVVKGARPDSDLLLASIGAETTFRNGYSLAARFDAEFAKNTQNYSATGRIRYRW
jgi:uncharacterized protein with beta-barrel porin domain